VFENKLIRNINETRVTISHNVRAFVATTDSSGFMVQGN